MSVFFLGLGRRTRAGQVLEPVVVVAEVAGVPLSRSWSMCA